MADPRRGENSFSFSGRLLLLQSGAGAVPEQRIALAMSAPRSTATGDSGIRHSGIPETQAVVSLGNQTPGSSPL